MREWLSGVRVRPIRWLRASMRTPRIVDDLGLLSDINASDDHVLVKVPVERGLSFGAFTVGPGSNHPWSLAARALARDQEDRAGLILRKYYGLVRPESLADWHDLQGEGCPGLFSLPPHAWALMPWISRSVEEHLRKVETAHIAENRLYGLASGVEAGAKAFGPMDESKLNVEMQRLMSLTKSIMARGFKPAAVDGDLGGRFLVANDRWRWLPSAGMHRVPVAAALGVHEFTVRIVSVVRREESSTWPHVRSGLFSERAALALFDRLLEGRPPACVTPWIEWVAGQDWHDD
jgi:hypothetical protein